MDMVEGRTKAKSGDKGELYKAEQILKDMWDKSKKDRDADVKVELTLPDEDIDHEADPAEERNNDEGRGTSGRDATFDTAEIDEGIVEVLAKALAKMKKAKLYRSGLPVLNGSSQIHLETPA